MNIGDSARSTFLEHGITVAVMARERKPDAIVNLSQEQVDEILGRHIVALRFPEWEGSCEVHVWYAFGRRGEMMTRAEVFLTRRHRRRT